MRRCTRKLVATLAAFAGALALATPVAVAQEEEAFEHFDRGAQYYFDGQYAEAIEAFEQGYQIEPHPMFQINIALSHWRLGRLEEAIEHGESVRDSEELETEVRTENAARLIVWRTALGARSATDSIARQRAKASVAHVEPPTPDEEIGVTQDADAAPLFGPIGWVGASMAGAGVVTLGVWSGLEVAMGNDVSAYRDAGESGDRERYEALRTDVERKQSVARVVLFSGLGLAAVGGGLLAYDVFAASDGTVAISVDPGRRTLVVHGSF